MQQQEVKQQLETVSAQQSSILMKNLIRTTISSITYLRNIFPEDCFVDKKLSGMVIKSLIPEKPEPRLVINWLENGVFDALDRKFLSDIIFAIYDMPPEAGSEETTLSDSNLLESYQFKVRYNDDDEVTGGTESLTSAIKSFSITQKSRATKDSSFTYTKKEIRDSTVILLRTLITLGQTMKPLPASRFLTIKLLYRDDITPLEFEPPYFTAADERDKLQFQEKPLSVRIGNIKTPFHELSLKVKSITDTFGEQENGCQDKSQEMYDAEQSDGEESKTECGHDEKQSEERDLQLEGSGRNSPARDGAAHKMEADDEAGDEGIDKEQFDSIYMSIKEQSIVVEAAPNIAYELIRDKYPLLSPLCARHVIKQIAEIQQALKELIHPDATAVEKVIHTVCCVPGAPMLANELFRDFNLPRNHVAEALKDAERYGLAIRVKRRLMLVPSAILPYLMKKKTVPQLSTQKCSDPISSPSVQSQSASQMDSQKENNIPAGRKRKLANDGQENHDDRSENKPSLLQQKINNGELQLSQSTDDDDFTTVSGGQRGHSAVKRRKTSVIKEPMRQIAEEGE